MKNKAYQLILKSVIILFFTNCKNTTTDQAGQEWHVYGGNAASTRYSPLSMIDTANVKNLKVAWTFRTGDLDTNNRGQMQCNPIIVKGIMYATSSNMKVFALDAATGTPRWTFDPFKQWGGKNSWAGTNRGVTYWSEGNDERIFYSAGSYLIGLDAKTGQPIATFGDTGRVDLRKELDYQREKFFIYANTPGIIYKNNIIIGSRVSEDLSAAPGHIRAFDVKTGKRSWIFHTIPHPNEKGYETWKDSTAWLHTGGANNWAGMCLDTKSGIVYVPTGSASYDFYGASRLGDNLFANCLLALNAETGDYIWHYQFIHHDIWDRDLPSNPTLVTVKKDGKSIEAVAQTTKHGLLFVFDRKTGIPVFPIIEQPVPPTDLEGEVTSATQPIPTLPQPFMPTSVSEADVIDITPAHKAEILPIFKQYKSGHQFMPPSVQGTVLYPGMDGGAEWGGAAFDASTGLFYVNANQVPWVIKMKKNASTLGKDILSLGTSVYISKCANCHGIERKGQGTAFPSLIDLNKKYDTPKLTALLQTGKNAMPAFDYLSEKERNALISFLLNLKIDPNSQKMTQNKPKEDEALYPKYSMEGYKKIITKDSLPATRPPWGTLNAIDLNTGKIAWKVPLGEIKKLTAMGIPITGTENYGGPVVTEGGLLFIAATKDEKIRAFDKKTGKILWEYQLPAAGYATPSVYAINGKQYIVIACGGGKLGTKSGDYYLAFSL
jgi:quinoprotein glucose dehydrogenase